MRYILPVLTAVALAAACDDRTVESGLAPDPVLPDAASPGAANESGVIAQAITQAEYDRVALRMSVAEVKAITGAGCTDTVVTGQPGAQTQSLVCLNASGASATFTFENGVLINKTSHDDLDATEPPPQ